MPTAWEQLRIAAERALARPEEPRLAWDRALRVGRTLQRLMELMPAEQRPASAEAGVAAAWFAGAIGMPSARGEWSAEEIQSRAETCAREHLSPEAASAMLAVLADARRRPPATVEGKLLADALALEDFGLLGLITQFRQARSAGRGVTQTLRLWRTQEDFGYWAMRLDGLHFPHTRRLAEARLEQARRAIEQLERENSAEDVA